ncbi:hypothetical protein GCM10010082_12570 [Kushneria pakistanensis]|uniref:DUF4174 domain-containing protein n=1 Tax=Kushneria pakistanensis TaxID=1508770 RepID=A0ABQ3FFJ6_9GAMM|nr:DUF4174 domain-containing protein [Kushneria pakistanensis]GHC22135.1 hypothetical protein GCM10010082_12570 [Kushneria pakistanensis]
MKHWIMPALLAAGLSGAGAQADQVDPAANPLLTDKWQSRPLVMVTPSADNSDYERMRGIVETQRNAFNDRDMVLYTVEDGAGMKEGERLTEAETGALLSSLGLNASGPLTTVLIGKDGGKKVQQEGFVDPRQLFDTVDNMPMRRARQ